MAPKNEIPKIATRDGVVETTHSAGSETQRLHHVRLLTLGCVSRLRADLDRKGICSKRRILSSGRVLGGGSFGRGRSIICCATASTGEKSCTRASPIGA